LNFSRYQRQVLLPQIGDRGQRRLAEARVLLVGCGALGTTIAEQLVRAGVGFLRVADRDLVELTNLQRQVLFDESDVAAASPKAIAAAERLTRINSQVEIEPAVTDVHAGNIESIADLPGAGFDLMIDGTDNVETRYLINDVSVKHGINWIYGACVGVEGRVMPVRPGTTACLRCVFPEPPGPGDLPTCDTAGVLGAAAAVVASIQSTIAIQLLTGAEPPNQLTRIDLWRGRLGATPLQDARRGDCICCGIRRFEFLEAPASGGSSTSLCGRNAVQVRPAVSGRIDLDALAHRLEPIAAVQRTPHLLKCRFPDGRRLSLTVFPDGRAIVHGTHEVAEARAMYARWIGS